MSLGWRQGRKNIIIKCLFQDLSREKLGWNRPYNSRNYRTPRKYYLFCGSFFVRSYISSLFHSMSLEMSTLVSFAKTKGFVYQGSEIYGGLANSWDYGPLGILLKENIKNLWIREFVQKRRDMVLLDAAIMMNPSVWIASGHVGSFSDPLMECKDCHTRHRADKLIEEKLEKDSAFPVPQNWAGDKTSLEDLNNYIAAGHIECPNCGAKHW